MSKPSGALCTWSIDISKSSIEIGQGYIDPLPIQAIVMKHIELNATPRAI
ncbi:MAG: hypothetical protein K2R98_04180 [Gemmataceae bacterium]|nr:hypothetical protein [Gemmataceae bacterium]